MKRLLAFTLSGFFLLFTTSLLAQADKSKRASPPDSVWQKIASGATIKISYSQPSLKGRIIGETVEPKKDTVWRMGANEATIFETDKDVTIEGKNLAAGKYSLFGLWTNEGYTLIFNNAWNIWGTQYDKNSDKDALRVMVQPRMVKDSKEKLTYTISKAGKVTLWWGNMAIDFNVK